MAGEQVSGFSVPAEGELVSVDVAGTPIAVVVLDGEVYAFADTCPHAGCSLADGDLEANEVVCPCHMARFDVRTGAVVDGPADSGVETWAASVTDGTLRLDGPRDPATDPGTTTEKASTKATSDAVAAESAVPAPDLDITALIEREHQAFRRQFAGLDQFSDGRALEAAWAALAALLEIHASGEESVLYPALVRTVDDAAPETEHAVRDHNHIRDALRAVQEHATGGTQWWAAVRAAEAVNEDHLQEEESDLLPAFRDRVDPARRAELGGQWLAFHDEHKDSQGLSGQHSDPQAIAHPDR